MTVDEFRAALEADPEKARLFEERLVNMKPEEAASKAEAISLAAAAVDLVLSPEEAERFFALGLEVDDAELEGVIGGNSYDTDKEGLDNSCVINWHCYYAFLHNTDSNDDSYTEYTRCWNDHNCYSSLSRNCITYVPVHSCIAFWKH